MSPCSTCVFSCPKQLDVMRLSHSAFVLVKIIVCPPAPVINKKNKKNKKNEKNKKNQKI